MTKTKLLNLHNFSTKNRTSILKSKQCGCFSCLNIFAPDEITDWSDENEENIGQTALCPFCSVDSVLPDAEVEITVDTLKSMQEYWF